MSADAWIEALGLEPHPEGGGYVQTWADESSSAIYYLLRAGEVSAWHRVEGCSEVWHHYAGAPLELSLSDDGETVRTLLLGSDLGAGERPQGVVPPGVWQSASLGTSAPSEAWSLVGCTVSPPFSFEAFELAPAGWAPGKFGPLVSAKWLTDHREEVVLIDVRYFLDGRSGHEAYLEGHLPGALWIDLNAGLADPPSTKGGRHPLPSPERFAAWMSRLGIGDGAPAVVAYDDNGGMSAGRLVWLLRILGHPAALLDGGLQAWARQGGAVEQGEVAARPATFTPQPWPGDRLVEIDEIGTVTSTGVLLDARAPERFRGEVEPLDARAGHIPDASNAPWQANLEDGRFAPAEALRKRFETLGAMDQEVVVYCGSGVTACHTLLALEAAGVEGAKLYPGSWSQWSGDPDRPAVKGDGGRPYAKEPE